MDLSHFAWHFGPIFGFREKKKSFLGGRSCHVSKDRIIWKLLLPFSLSQFNEVSQLYTIYDFQQIKKGVWTYFRDVPRSSLKKWDRDRSWNWLKNISVSGARNLKFYNDFFVKPISNKYISGNGRELKIANNLIFFFNFFRQIDLHLQFLANFQRAEL